MWWESTTFRRLMLMQENPFAAHSAQSERACTFRSLALLLSIDNKTGRPIWCSVFFDLLHSHKEKIMQMICAQDDLSSVNQVIFHFVGMLWQPTKWKCAQMLTMLKWSLFWCIIFLWLLIILSPLYSNQWTITMQKRSLSARITVIKRDMLWNVCHRAPKQCNELGMIKDKQAVVHKLSEFWWWLKPTLQRFHYQPVWKRIPWKLGE